jgi:putative ABC transport system permease protein
MAPNLPFSHRFMDESFDQVYRSETRISQIFSIFSGLSIFIACLGLFGLAAFATERRTKEIGIRKVLGATKANLVGLMSKDFLKPVTISLIIAIPIAWYFMNEWLVDFAYRIDIEWWIFALAGVLALIIAFMTVSFQSLKAASANPVDALKSE